MTEYIVSDGFGLISKWEDRPPEVVRCADCRHCRTFTVFNDYTEKLKCFRTDNPMDVDARFYCAGGEVKMGDLLPCPFCGGEAELHPTYDMDTNEVDGWFAWCAMENDCAINPQTDAYLTEAEAIEAWNTRAAYEIDGWFYLPKPKQQLFNYTTSFSYDDLSLKATGTVDVYAITRAVQKWQEEELNQHIVERICEVFRPERTCRNDSLKRDAGVFACSECGVYLDIADMNWDGEDDSGGFYEPNYCPNCGAKVIA